MLYHGDPLPVHLLATIGMPGWAVAAGGTAVIALVAARGNAQVAASWRAMTGHDAASGDD
jgi:hypothetical protein